MTNQDVIKQFKQGLGGHSLHMTSTGTKLYSYNTVVAQWVEGQCVLNVTKYSSTTSKQLSHFRGFEDKQTVRPVPQETQDLTPYFTQTTHEKYLTFQDCYTLLQSLAKSQDTYQRILEECNQFNEEQIMKAEAMLKKLKFRESIDFIFWLEIIKKLNNS